MLCHARLGSGPPLLLVHPYGLTHRVWNPVADRLATEHEVVAVDLPGFGDSPNVAGTPTLRALTEACAELMASFGHERFHVAGNSTGGGVALHLALDGRALSACAISPIGFMEGWERAYLALTLWSFRASAFLGGPLASAPAPVRRAAMLQAAAHADRIPPHELADIFARLKAAPGYWRTSRHAVTWRCPPVDSLPCPVTVAWGEKDRLLLTGPQSARARDRLPSARHVVLRDTGHVPMYDDPELVAATIRASVAA